MTYVSLLPATGEGGTSDAPVTQRELRNKAMQSHRHVR